MRVGYVRVSTVDLNTVRQLDGVAVDRVFTDTASGKDANSPRLLQDKGQYPALTERQHALAGHLVVGRADPATAGAAVAVTIAGHAVGRLRRHPPARRRAVLPGDWVTRTVPGADARVGR